MRLTIVVVDGLVCKDGICYENLQWNGTPVDARALQWFDVDGWIELNTGAANEVITELPAWANSALNAWDVANQPKPPAPITPEMNQETASGLLYATDWTTIPDVADPEKSNPYLINVSDFIAYRNQVRQYAINPIAGEISWPEKPVAVWSE